MKKLVRKLAILTIVLFSVSTVIAEEAAEDSAANNEMAGNLDGYGVAGCGLGSIAFGPGDGFVQNFAVTTNGIGAYGLNTQSVGITLGTSNCTDHMKGALKAEVEQKLYVRANYKTMQKDTARGGGENLTTFASLLGCSEDSIAEFNRTAHTNYGKIFKAEAGPEEVVANFKSVARSNKQLAQTCKAL